MKKIALLDGQTIQAISFAECLKQHGYYVVSLCESKNSYGYRTKFVDKKIESLPTKNNMNNYHQFLTRILIKEDIDVIVPMNDDSALYVSAYAEELRKYTNFIMPELKTFLKGYDKNELMKICRLYKYPHPHTYTIDVNNIVLAADYVGFPALIKPNQTSGARGFAVVNSESEIYKKLPDIIERYGKCHLQKLVAEGGRQFKVELFIKDGELINSTVIHKMRFYPEKGGSSCFNQTIINDDLVQICFNVLKTISWKGFADFDLIEDPADGIIKIMEINPRVPACIKACFQANVDFADNIVCASLGEPLKHYEYNPGNYLRYLGLDLLWFLGSPNRFTSNPPWFKYFFDSRHSLQDGGGDDIKPLLYGTIGGLLKYINPHFREEKKGMI